ncbi:MAG: metallophosphoesterase family protein, partial [Pseudomonadota bacterium]
MRLAILADIHGNLDALEAVLTDLRGRQVDRVFVLGDHASGPLDPIGTLDRLMALGGDVQFLRGNHDRWLIERALEAMGPSDAQTLPLLSQHHLDWLKALPPTLALEDVFACHGTPQSDTTYWLEKVSAEGVVHPRALGEIEALAADAVPSEGAGPALLLCGHTHLPRAVALRDGRMVVNPGSVGLPGYDDDSPVPHVMQTGVPHASYAVVERSAESMLGRAWSVVFHLVPYNAEPMAQRAEENGR